MQKASTGQLGPTLKDLRLSPELTLDRGMEANAPLAPGNLPPSDQSLPGEESQSGGSSPDTDPETDVLQLETPSKSIDIEEVVKSSSPVNTPIKSGTGSSQRTPCAFFLKRGIPDWSSMPDVPLVEPEPILFELDDEEEEEEDRPGSAVQTSSLSSFSTFLPFRLDKPKAQSPVDTRSPLKTVAAARKAVFSPPTKAPTPPSSPPLEEEEFMVVDEAVSPFTFSRIKRRRSTPKMLETSSSSEHGSPGKRSKNPQSSTNTPVKTGSEQSSSKASRKKYPKRKVSSQRSAVQTEEQPTMDSSEEEQTDSSDSVVLSSKRQRKPPGEWWKSHGITDLGDLSVSSSRVKQNSSKTSRRTRRPSQTEGQVEAEGTGQRAGKKKPTAQTGDSVSEISNVAISPEPQQGAPEPLEPPPTETLTSTLKGGGAPEPPPKETLTSTLKGGGAPEPPPTETLTSTPKAVSLISSSFFAQLGAISSSGTASTAALLHKTRDVNPFPLEEEEEEEPAAPPSQSSLLEDTESHSVEHSASEDAGIQNVEHSAMEDAGIQNVEHSAMEDAGIQNVEHSAMEDAGIQNVEHSAMEDAGIQNVEHSAMEDAGIQDAVVEVACQHLVVMSASPVVAEPSLRRWPSNNYSFPSRNRLSDNSQGFVSGPSSMIELNSCEEEDAFLPSSTWSVQSPLSATEMCVHPLTPVSLTDQDRERLTLWLDTAWPAPAHGAAGGSCSTDSFRWYSHRGRLLGVCTDVVHDNFCAGNMLLGSNMRKPLWVDHSATTVYHVMLGSVAVTLDGVTSLYSRRQCFMVSCGQAHSLKNPGEEPLMLGFTRMLATEAASDDGQ